MGVRRPQAECGGATAMQTAEGATTITEEARPVAGEGGPEAHDGLAPRMNSVGSGEAGRPGGSWVDQRGWLRTDY